MKNPQLSIYFESVNFTTPEILEYGHLGQRMVYELSQGDFLGQELYGVTVARMTTKSYQPLHNLCKSFDSLRHARVYIQHLREVNHYSEQKLRHSIQQDAKWEAQELEGGDTA